MSDKSVVVKDNIDTIGIDIQKNGVILSLISDGKKEANTIMDAQSSKSKVFPLSISKEKELGRWYVGEEAVKSSALYGTNRVDDLYEKAYLKEQVEIEGKIYTFEELFSTYLRRIIEENGADTGYIKKIIVTIPEVDARSVELFSMIGSRLSIKKDSLILIDHKEAFIYYTLTSNQNIFAHDVALFDYNFGRILCYLLSRNTKTRPQIVEIDILKDEINSLNQDSRFLEFINKAFKDRTITSVFLTGDGFEGDWMKESVELLCKGRRVFAGDNIYSKGAAMAGLVKQNRLPWSYVYIGDHEMKMNLSLKVNDRNDMTFVTLVNAGENWYETGMSCEVILDGTPEFECWVQSPKTRRTKVTMIELKDIPKRENRTTRLRISATPLSDKTVKLIIKDVGFGDIAPATNKIWEHIVDMTPGEEE